VKISRLFEIVYVLMEKKKTTATELASRFEVSKRTILRDIEALVTAGIPVYTTRGKGGGVFIQDRFVLNKTIVSESEQSQILFALQSMSATGYIESDNIIRRLRSLFQKEERDWIEVDFSRWGDEAREKAKFEFLKNAIIDQRAISFTYYSSYGETIDRRVHPLKLVFKSKSWYLQAFCLLRNDYRTFKISRMTDVTLLNDAFDNNLYKIPEIEGDGNKSPELIKIKLRFEPHAAYRVYDEFNQREIVKNNDGSFAVTFDVPRDYWIYDYILSFGAAVEVLEPDNVREEVCCQAEIIRKKYLSET